jgi:TolB-like protein
VVETIGQLGLADEKQLQSLRATDVFTDDILSQRDRILSSRCFRHVHDKTKDFLSFVLGKKLIGREGEIKEVTIAVHVYGERADYDSAESAKIRVAADALRKRLAQYYSGEGESDPLEITIPKGTYVPEIEDRRVVVEISPFENWNPRQGDGHFCPFVREEVAESLKRVGHIEVRKRSTSVPDLWPRCYRLRGSLQSCDEQVRLNISLVDVRGQAIVSYRHFAGARDHLVRLCRQIAGHVVKALRGIPNSGHTGRHERELTLNMKRVHG